MPAYNATNVGYKFGVGGTMSGTHKERGRGRTQVPTTSSSVQRALAGQSLGVAAQGEDRRRHSLCPLSCTYSSLLDAWQLRPACHLARQDVPALNSLGLTVARLCQGSLEQR